MRCRWQTEAQQTKLAVSACNQYATNAKYIEINSGRHPCIKVFPGMHALSPDEVDVYSSLVERCPSARVTVTHGHSMTEQVMARGKKCATASMPDDYFFAQGMIEGFRFTIHPRENHQFLPINRRMFFRHTMVECMPSAYVPPSSSMGCDKAAKVAPTSSDATSSQEDRTILELLLRQNEVKDRLVKIMQKLHAVGCLLLDFFNV